MQPACRVSVKLPAEARVAPQPGFRLLCLCLSILGSTTASCVPASRRSSSVFARALGWRVTAWLGTCPIAVESPSLTRLAVTSYRASSCPAVASALPLGSSLVCFGEKLRTRSSFVTRFVCEPLHPRGGWMDLRASAGWRRLACAGPVAPVLPCRAFDLVSGVRSRFASLGGLPTASRRPALQLPYPTPAASILNERPAL